MVYRSVVSGISESEALEELQTSFIVFPDSCIGHIGSGDVKRPLEQVLGYALTSPIWMDHYMLDLSEGITLSI